MLRSKRTTFLWRAYIGCLETLLLLLAGASALHAQEGFKTETSSGVSNIRIAVADFKPTSTDPQTAALKHTLEIA